MLVSEKSITFAKLLNERDGLERIGIGYFSEKDAFGCALLLESEASQGIYLY